MSKEREREVVKGRRVRDEMTWEPTNYVANSPTNICLWRNDMKGTKIFVTKIFGFVSGTTIFVTKRH